MKNKRDAEAFLLLLDPPEKWIRNPLSVELAPLIRQFAESVRESDALDLKACGIIIYNGSYIHRRRVELFLSSQRPRKEEKKEEYVPQIEPALRKGARAVTLEDLVRALHEAISRIKFRSTRRAGKEARKEVDVIIDGEEVRIEDLMEEIYMRIRKLADGGRVVSFKRLILSYDWRSMTLEAARLKLARILLCLLHLASHKKINLLQGEEGEVEVVILG